MAEHNKIRLVQAGVGGMGRTWWKGPVSSSPDFEVVAIVDIAADPLKEAGEALGVPENRRFHDLKAALDAVGKDGAQAVLTVTPPAIHAVHAELAFSRGLHLLTEKPISDSIESAKRMVRQASDAGKQLVVAQNYRFSNGARRFKDLVSEAPLGSCGHGHLDFYIPGDFAQTFRGTMDYPLLVDMAIHHFDLIRSVTGRNISRITAQSFRPSWSWYRHDPGFKALLELDGGIPFSYSGDWSAFGKTTSWNGNWRLQCERGNLSWEDDKLSLHRCEFWGNHRTCELIDIPNLPVQGQAKLLADFASAIRSGQPAETSGQDNLFSFATVMAGVKSIHEKRTVDIAELLA
jgi:predicted dehydrogenase